MTVNNSAKLYRIWVRKPDEVGLGLEVTRLCGEGSNGYFVANESEASESGLITVSGKLSLIPIAGYWDGASYVEFTDGDVSGIDVFDPDLNPERPPLTPIKALLPTV